MALLYLKKLQSFPCDGTLRRESVKCNCFGNIFQRHQERLWCPWGFKTQIISTVFLGLFFFFFLIYIPINHKVLTTWQIFLCMAFNWYFQESNNISQGGERADKNKFPTVDSQSFRSQKFFPSYKVALLQRDENHPNGVEKLLLFLNHISVEGKEMHLHY